MKTTNRIQDLWETGTRQATSVPKNAREDEDRAGWVERQLAGHPTLTLGIGLALGVTIGWLIKRR